MITFLVPTFNEKENIFLFINTINSLKIKVEYEFLFVDDNSLDGTKNELSNAKKQYSNVSSYLLYHSYCTGIHDIQLYIYIYGLYATALCDG